MISNVNNVRCNRSPVLLTNGATTIIYHCNRYGISICIVICRRIVIDTYCHEQTPI